MYSSPPSSSCSFLPQPIPKIQSKRMLFEGFRLLTHPHSAPHHCAVWSNEFFDSVTTSLLGELSDQLILASQRASHASVLVVSKSRARVRSSTASRRPFSSNFSEAAIVVSECMSLMTQAFIQDGGSLTGDEGLQR